MYETLKESMVGCAYIISGAAGPCATEGQAASSFLLLIVITSAHWGGGSRIDSGGGGVVEFILLFTHARQIDITTLRTESREELEVRDGSLFAVISYEKGGVCSFLYVSSLV